MALDPSIALGIRPLEVPNQLAQYAQMAQVENAQQQNALAQFQLGAARRAEQGQNALGQAYGEFYGGGGTGGAGMGGAPGSVPGAIPYGAMRESIVQKLRTTAPHLIPAELARINEMEQKALSSRKTQGEIEAQASTQIDKALDLYRKEVPRINDADAAIRFVKAQYADPVIGKIASRFQSLEQTIEETIKEFSTPEGIQKWKIQNAGITGDKLIEMMRETTDKTDLGGQVREQRRDYFGRPIGTPINTQKTATIGDITGQQRLAFDQAKFAWEKANPNKTIHEDANGLLAVDNRTGVATPVVYGPTGIQPAPVAAPGASMMRQPPPAALPGQRTPVIPGMTSVLDQVAAPGAAMPLPAEGGVRVPGAPVGGKLKTMPEQYSKQAMGVLNTHDALVKMQDTMKNFTGSDMLNPTRRAELGSAHATALLFAKELFNLGVLNGGDERIVNSVINNPIDFSSTAIPIAAIRKQATDLQGVVDRTNQNLATVYKQTPLKLKAVEPSGDNTDLHNQADSIIRGGNNGNRR